MYVCVILIKDGSEETSLGRSLRGKVRHILFFSRILLDSPKRLTRETIKRREGKI